MSYIIEVTLDKIKYLEREAAEDDINFDACNNVKFFACLNYGVICGFIGLSEYPHKGIIKKIFVRKWARGHGVFRALLLHVLDYLKQKGKSAEANAVTASLHEFHNQGFKDKIIYLHGAKVYKEIL
jgi:GNAT superfamily N-acetyltransferase